MIFKPVKTNEDKSRLEIHTYKHFKKVHSNGKKKTLQLQDCNPQSLTLRWGDLQLTKLICTSTLAHDFVRQVRLNYSNVFPLV